uniref:SOSEKI DIX-like domain-containing protein n=1 Tax=Oryza punctata TaxID=4537 RepID=A0A0E0M4S8_ORYPU
MSSLSQAEAGKSSKTAGELTTSEKKKKKTRKVAVVYYLCRSRQGGLEHPHLMEVEVADGEQVQLRLRDVTRRLDGLRGKGMAGMYSWSCKRSYRGGYVWHDLSHPDDLLLPTHAPADYVLKASLLHSTTATPLASTNANANDQRTSPPHSSSSSSSSSSVSSSSSSSSPNTNNKKKEERRPAAVVVATAATQTDDDCSFTATGSIAAPSAQKKLGAAAAGGRGSSSSSRSLESLIMAEYSGFKSMLEEDDGDEEEEESAGGADDDSSSSRRRSCSMSIYRVKPANLLMRLIACGCGASIPMPAAAKQQLQPQPQQVESLPLSPVLSPLPHLVNKHPQPPQQQKQVHCNAAAGKLKVAVDDAPAPPLVQVECSNAPREDLDFAAGNTPPLPHSTPVVVAFRLDKHDDKVIKIEERLASGARVAISSSTVHPAAGGLLL